MAENSTDTQNFDPHAYLSSVSGQDYLEVKWRLLWFRNENPDGHLETKLESHDGQFAVFSCYARKADVLDANGTVVQKGGSATGWGSEQYNDFRDYIEKAETKAIGRALAALGYGTQFTYDLSDADHGRIADAPVNRQPPSGGGRQSSGGARPGGGGGTEQASTPRQMQFIAAIARELGMSEAQLREESESSFGRDVSQLNRRDASVFIERLQQRRAEGGANPR